MRDYRRLCFAPVDLALAWDLHRILAQNTSRAFPVELTFGALFLFTHKGVLGPALNSRGLWFSNLLVGLGLTRAGERLVSECKPQRARFCLPFPLSEFTTLFTFELR